MTDGRDVAVPGLGSIGPHRKRRVATALLVAAAALGAGMAITAEPAAGAPAYGPGCEPQRSGVVFTPGKTLSVPSSVRPVPCLVTIPKSTAAKETQIVVTDRGTIVYQADLIMRDGAAANAPKMVAVSTTKGRTWSLRGENVATDNLRTSGIDNHLYRDPTTDRVFWVPNGTGEPPQEVIGASDDGGLTWTLSHLPCCSLAENPNMLAAKPRAGATVGYPNVLYWCTNTSLIGGIVFPIGERICWKSRDGGSTWGNQFTLLSKVPAAPAHSACLGRGEMFDALDGYYPSADATGRLYLPVRCGPTTEYAEGPPEGNPAFLVVSDNEGTTWTQVSKLPDLPSGYGVSASAFKEELRADRLGNLYLVRGTAEPTRAIYLWVSKDKGKTWSSPRNITIPGTRSYQDPLWQVAVGEPGHLVLNYNGTQGERAALNAYMVDTRNALSTKPLLRGAAINDPKGTRHVPYALGSEDYTHVAMASNGTAYAAFPRGWVGSLSNLSARIPGVGSGGATRGTSGLSGRGGGLATTGAPLALALTGLVLLGLGVRLRRWVIR